MHGFCDKTYALKHIKITTYKNSLIFKFKNIENSQNVIFQLTFRRCLQKNNIFPVIVFGEIFENLQLLSLLKLKKMAAISPK